MQRRGALRRYRLGRVAGALPGLSSRRRRRHRRSARTASSVGRYLRATSADETPGLDSGRYQGLAFGAEFCHRRLPSLDRIRDALVRCQSLKIGFTLVTPVVREGAFDDVAAWLARVAEELPGQEWVVNDWGLLMWVRDRKLPLRPVAGRLLGRQRRGPRVVEMMRSASPEDVEALKGSAWDDPRASSLLLELGVGRVELDVLLQGCRRPSLPPGVSLSLCGPWVPVTLSPSCPWSSDPLHCPRSCRSSAPVKLTTPEDPQPLWSRGNALFVRRDREPEASVVASLGADRLIWAERIPG